MVEETLPKAVFIMIRQRLYNPAQLTPDELKASFVARGDTLAELLRLLANQTPGRPCQHMMLIGPRGMGKTTLGLRFLHAILEAPDLAMGWQPVPFYEESYDIGDLADFWLAALRHLTRATDDPVWADTADALVKDHRDHERLAAYALAALMDYCQSSGKRLLLFVENLDGILTQLRGDREAHALRAHLIERPEILVLGSANTVFDAIRGHGRPLYEFFRLFFLHGIGAEETGRLLDMLAGREGRPDIQQALNLERGRLETLRRLTGGNPRLLVLACRMLIESPLGSAFEDLEQLIDEQTPYFKARIEELPIQARKVFHCLADGWKPMLAKEVADTAQLTSSHASAQIKQLVEKGYAREVHLPEAKRTRYEVRDRFYNIYYLLRFSPTNRNRLERLVTFLHDMFGMTGMRRMYPTFLETLRTDRSRTGDLSDWIEIMAGYVAADTDFQGREDWRRKALELARDLIGPNTPVAESIQRVFTAQYPTIQSNIDEWMQSGRELLKSDNYIDAERAYRKAVDLQPDNLVARIMLGLALNFRGHHKDSCSEFDHVLENAPQDDSLKSRTSIVAALSGRSLACYELERTEFAVATSRKVAECVGPNDSVVLRRLAASTFATNGSILSKFSRPKEAIDIWAQGLGFIRPDDPEDSRLVATKMLTGMGSALVKVERHGEAIDARQRVSEYVNADDTIKLRKEVMRALIANSVALFPEEYGQDSTLENYGESIAAMRSASEYVRPDDPKEMRVLVGELLSIAGHLLNLYGRFGEAEVASRKATDIDPSHGESWRVLAEAILQQPDDARLTEAEECARRASDLAPGNPIALRTLSDVLSRLGKSTESLDYLARSLRVGGGEVQLSSVAGLTESLVSAVASGNGRRVKRMMEEAGLTESMEPLWHAVRSDLGEEIDPLPAEIMDTVKEIRLKFKQMRTCTPPTVPER